MKSRASGVVEERNFGEGASINFSGYVKTGLWKANYALFLRHLAETLHKKIPSLAKEYGGDLRGVLHGTEEEFAREKDKFLDKVEDEVKGIPML